MTKRVKIPESIEAASDRLAALDGIATATGWERAAIVFAFTKDEGRGSWSSRGNPRLTFTKFAAKKIVGLSDHGSVAIYHRAWQYAIDQGAAQSIEPGQAITLPVIDWPPTRTGTDGYNSAEGARKVLRKIVDTHPEVLVEVEPEIAKHVAASPSARKAVREAVEDDQEKRRKQSTMPRPKGTMPTREPKPLTELDVVMMRAELSVFCSKAVRGACDFHEELQEVRDYLSEEDIDNLRETVERTITAWQMARDSLTGVTDEALWAEMEEL